MSLKDAIRRSRQRKAAGNSEDIRAFMGEAAATRAEELFDELLDELKAQGMQELRRVLSTIKKGDKGDPGLDGDDGEDGADGESVQGLPGKDGKSVKGDRGDPGKDGREISVSDLLKKINSITEGVKITTVRGLNDRLKQIQVTLRNHARKQSSGKAKQQGGGMTLDAGANTTLTRVAATGRWIITGAAAGGANVATEKMTPTTSGSDVTLDLTALAHTYSGVLIVTRNGQVLMPNGSAALPGSSWSQSGSTVTVYNADDTDVYLLQYTYA